MDTTSQWHLSQVCVCGKGGGAAEVWYRKEPRYPHCSQQSNQSEGVRALTIWFGAGGSGSGHIPHRRPHKTVKETKPTVAWCRQAGEPQDEMQQNLFKVGKKLFYIYEIIFLKLF